jgi:hypothetical protein
MKDKERAVQTEAVVGLLGGLRSAAYDLFRTSVSARVRHDLATDSSDTSISFCTQAEWYLAVPA